jgi:uncharacterized protein YbaR (Trm112 family)
MISPDMLARLVCPDDRSPLRLAEPALVDRLNQAIARGQVRNRAGARVAGRLDGLLVRADGALAYPIHDAIPHLLTDEAILLAGFE